LSFFRNRFFQGAGAFNKLLSLSAEERKRGVVAISGGNHAQAVAYASSVLGTDAVCSCLHLRRRITSDTTKNYGASRRSATTIADAFAKIKNYETEGRTFIHPFDDPLVMAGQGTLGAEIMEDLPDATDIIISIGGGGFGGGRINERSKP
jgi:threonine dehydratase